jgi:hypothetical protein
MLFARHDPDKAQFGTTESPSPLSLKGLQSFKAEQEKRHLERWAS